MGPLRIALVIAAVLVVSALGYLFWPWRDAIPLPKAEAPAAPVAQPPSGPRHPIAETEARALPALGESDPAMVKACRKKIADAGGKVIVEEQKVLGMGAFALFAGSGRPGSRHLEAGRAKVLLPGPDQGITHTDEGKSAL